MMPRRGEKGFTLIELMVAMLISIILLAGVISVFMTSKRTNLARDGLSVIQENGRVAIKRLRQGLSPAGYPTYDLVLPIAFPTDLPDDLVGDSITIQFTAGGTTYVMDCLGQSSNIQVGDTVLNSFYVQDGSLKCRGSNGGGGQPLADGIQEMRVLYGLDSNSDGVADQYLSADGLKGGFAPSSFALEQRLINVVSIRIALLVNSIEPAKDEIGTLKTHNLLGTETRERKDLLMRRVFTTTIPLRNRMPQR